MPHKLKILWAEKSGAGMTLDVLAKDTSKQYSNNCELHERCQRHFNATAQTMPKASRSISCGQSCCQDNGRTFAMQLTRVNSSNVRAVSLKHFYQCCVCASGMSRCISLPRNLLQHHPSVSQRHPSTNCSRVQKCNWGHKVRMGSRGDMQVSRLPWSFAYTVGTVSLFRPVPP